MCTKLPLLKQKRLQMCLESSLSEQFLPLLLLLLHDFTKLSRSFKFTVNAKYQIHNDMRWKPMVNLLFADLLNVYFVRTIGVS